MGVKKEKPAPLDEGRAFLHHSSILKECVTYLKVTYAAFLAAA